MKFNVNEKYINLTIDAFEGPNGETLVNYTSDTYVDVLKIFFSVSVSLPNGGGRDKNEIFKTTLDLCKIQDGLRGNFVASVVMEHFNSSADYAMQCPLKAGVAHMYNFQITDSFFPTYILMNNVKFTMDLQAKAKIANVKKLLYWYSIKLEGEVRKT